MSTQAQPAADANNDSLAGLLRFWDRFWFNPIDPTTLGFVRLSCGLLSFYILLCYSWGLLSFVGPDAWLDREAAQHMLYKVEVWAPPMDWSMQNVKISEGSWYWSIYYHISDPVLIWAIHISILAATLAFALGLWTRWTGLLTWVGAMMYVQRATSTVFGLDTMMMIVLLYLQFGPSGSALSLDRWLAVRRAKQRGEPIPEIQPSMAANFALRLIQVHFCIIYLAGGTSKLLGSTWWGGTALNYVLLNWEFTPLAQPWYYNSLKWLAQSRPMWETFMTFSILFTLMLELSFAFVVWDRRWRWFMISCSIMLHMGIGLFMGLVTFSMMMMIMVSSFIPPEAIKGAVADLLTAKEETDAPQQASTPARGELVGVR